MCNLEPVVSRDPRITLRMETKRPVRDPGDGALGQVSGFRHQSKG